MLALQIQIAKAKASVKRKKRKQASEKTLADTNRLVSDLVEKAVTSLPEAPQGRDGRDAPSLEEVLEGIKPFLPEPKIETVVKQERYVDEDAMQDFFNKKLPEMEKQFRPKVELIREEIDESKLEGFATKEDLDKALQRVQDAISYHSGGAGIKELTNVIEVGESTTIRDNQLLTNYINVILVTAPEISITLPEPDVTKIVWVQQGYTGEGTFNICKEAT